MMKKLILNANMNKAKIITKRENVDRISKKKIKKCFFRSINFTEEHDDINAKSG